MAIVFKLDDGAVKQVVIKSTKGVKGIKPDTFADVAVELGKKVQSAKSSAAFGTVSGTGASAANGCGFSFGSCAAPVKP